MKKNSRYFLVYTLILFSVAFILILFSSFTGVRYKDAQNEKNKLFQGAQESVVKLTEKNELLEKENKGMADTISQLTKDNEDLKTINGQRDETIKNMEILAEVQNLYRNKYYSRAKELLDTIVPDTLGENAKTLYESLKNRL